MEEAVEDTAGAVVVTARFWPLPTFCGVPAVCPDGAGRCLGVASLGLRAGAVLLVLEAIDDWGLAPVLLGGTARVALVTGAEGEG